MLLLYCVGGFALLALNNKFTTKTYSHLGYTAPTNIVHPVGLEGKSWCSKKVGSRLLASLIPPAKGSIISSYIAIFCRITKVHRAYNQVKTPKTCIFIKVTTIRGAERQHADGVVHRDNEKYTVWGAATVQLRYQPSGWDKNRLVGIGTV